MRVPISDDEYEKLKVRSVGPKGRLAVVPEGWHLVARGPVYTGDKFAHTVTAKWVDTDEDDLLLQAENFDALIRKC